MTEIEIPQGFSRNEVCLMLNRVRTRCSKPPVSEATFYRWLGELGISPKFRYTADDVKRLQRLCLHYAQGGKTSNCPDI